MKELIVKEKKEIESLFMSPGGIEPILERIKDVALDFESNLDTDKGRKVYSSQAMSVSRSKVYLEGIASELKKDAQARIATVNATRDRIKSFCDELRDEIRGPLTEYENNKKKERDNLNNKLALLINIVSETNFRSDLTYMTKKIIELESMVMAVTDGSWGDLEREAHSAIERGLKHLKKCVLDRESYDKDQKDLAILREKERLRKEEDEKRLAIEKEKKDKELAIERERQSRLDSENKKQREEIERVEREKESLRQQEEKERLDKERAVIEKDEANKRAQEAELRLREMEQEKIEEEKIKNAAIELAKKNEIENRRKVHNLIVKSLVSLGLDVEECVGIVRAIAQRKISRLKIDYTGDL